MKKMNKTEAKERVSLYMSKVISKKSKITAAQKGMTRPAWIISLILKYYDGE